MFFAAKSRAAVGFFPFLHYRFCELVKVVWQLLPTLRATETSMNPVTTELLMRNTEIAEAMPALGNIQIGFETILSSIPDRVYIKDRESRFLKINGAAAKRLGLED